MITTSQVTRVFKYDGTELPDPLPGQSPTKSLAVLRASYPQFVNATVDGPFFESGKEVWQIKVAAGTKG